MQNCSTETATCEAVVYLSNKRTNFASLQRILHLLTAKDKTESGQVAVEESLLHRINPSLNQVSKATIECSLYVPPGKNQLLVLCHLPYMCFVKILIP